MPKLQKEFSALHDSIKLGTYEENKTLQEKRDMLLNELKSGLKDEKVPDTDKSLTFTSFGQGSYAMIIRHWHTVHYACAQNQILPEPCHYLLLPDRGYELQDCRGVPQVREPL